MKCANSHMGYVVYTWFDFMGIITYEYKYAYCTYFENSLNIMNAREWMLIADLGYLKDPWMTKKARISKFREGKNINQKNKRHINIITNSKQNEAIISTSAKISSNEWIHLQWATSTPKFHSKIVAYVSHSLAKIVGIRHRFGEVHASL